MTVVNSANTYLPGTIAIPSSMVISGITNSYPMVVTAVLNTTTEANTYIPGMLIKLFVPYAYGMYQANGLQGQILTVSGLDFTVDIDSRLFDVFVTPPSTTMIQPPSLSPAGSRNLQYDNTTNLVAFQSLNDQGN
jgi:hypothetical protein